MNPSVPTKPAQNLPRDQDPLCSLVTLDADNTPVTTSLAVAESFGKRHDHVLRDIEALDVTEDLDAPKFGAISYTDKLNRPKKAYVMTRDGFLELTLRYRGKKAKKFREDFIREFNRAEDLVVLDADNTPVTTSLAVAESFGKKHGHVIRDIEALDVIQVFDLPKFGEISYTDKWNRQKKAYVMTRDGFLRPASRNRGK